MWSLSNVLLYKFNAFSFLAKHSSCTVAITFAVWGVTEKVAWISLSFFTISQIEYDLFLLWILANLADAFSFLKKSSTFTFSLKRRNLWLLSGASNCCHHYSWALRPSLSKMVTIPGSLEHSTNILWQSIITQIAAEWWTGETGWTNGRFTSQGQGSGFHHPSQNSSKLETSELLLSGI